MLHETRFRGNPDLSEITWRVQERASRSSGRDVVACSELGEFSERNGSTAILAWK